MKNVWKKVLALGLASALILGVAQAPVAASEASPTTSVEATRDPAATGSGASTGTTTTDTTTTGSTTTDKSSTTIMSKDAEVEAELTVKSVDATKKTKTIKIGSTATINGRKYKVTRIAANAFKNAPNATSIFIPCTVDTIDKNAFKGLTKLKTITYRIKTLKNRTIAEGAFNGVDTTKVTIKVSKNISAKQLKAVKAGFKKAGFKGKITKASS